ncbi:hypothetical protein ACFU51_28380 [Streptomyces sp. NPDC057430]|uniref:hypothetical protein n=1 Tax=Streptomyces sp. NPDC057430 TaxID=3346131 RepID=UPI00369780B4
MDIFDNAGANAGFGALVFGAMATVAIVAGLKYRWLRDRKTLFLVAFFVLLVTVNSGGLFGEVAGALRGGMNIAGEKAVDGIAGAAVAPNPPRSTVTPLSAGGAAIGLCGLTWYAIKLFAAKGKARDIKEMSMGAAVGICYGTSLGFMGWIVGATVIVGNNVGLYVFGG